LKKRGKGKKKWEGEKSGRKRKEIRKWKAKKEKCRKGNK
jgi:hypothetical protein